MFLSHLFPGQRLSALWDKKTPTSPFYKLSLHHGPLLHGTCHRCNFTESWALPCDFTNATFPSRLYTEPGQGPRLSLVHHFIPIPSPVPTGRALQVSAERMVSLPKLYTLLGLFLSFLFRCSDTTLFCLFVQWNKIC